ncbi:Ger(x)C family spore germination protein [Sediminibacillus massiliensis]|uniref:Ger(x)C family spore germination protein n=1 Tax=Sediminibacillus massiliensis TaxID=1926277 RepID=UPI0009883C8E|nr:Ger(x)C family spore germination protein [Sediminibacillus massiliensis]
MKLLYKAMLLLISLVLLAGCWDQRQFKNFKLVLASGLDITEDGKVKSTVVISNVEGGNQGSGREQVQVVNAVGSTSLDTRTIIDQKISKRYDASKLTVLLLGEKLARTDIYPFLDMFYRDPKSNLHSRLAVLGGSVEEALSLKIPGEPRISEYINGMLTGEISSTHTPDNNIQLVCAELLEPGQDFVLPYLTVNKEEGFLQYQGLALFKEKTFTGSVLTPQRSVLYLLMKGKRGSDAFLTKKVSDNGKTETENFITIDVKEIKRKLNINVNNGAPSVDMDLTFKVDIMEFPPDSLNRLKKVRELESKLSANLTEEAESLFAQLQEAGSDAFGIGRRVKAFHPEVWKSLDWNTVYPELSIKPDIKVEVQSHGIIN